MPRMLPVALRYTSIIEVRLRMPGRVDHGGEYALLEPADSAPPNIATSRAGDRAASASRGFVIRSALGAGRTAGPAERRFEERGVIAISDGCYLDSTFFTGANDPVEPECRPLPPAGRKPSSQKGRTAAAILCASLLGLGLAFFACTLLIPALGLGWSDVVCLGANFESSADGTHQRVMLRAGTTTTGRAGASALERGM